MESKTPLGVSSRHGAKLLSDTFQPLGRNADVDMLQNLMREGPLWILPALSLLPLSLLLLLVVLLLLNSPECLSHMLAGEHTYNQSGQQPLDGCSQSPRPYRQLLSADWSAQPPKTLHCPHALAASAFVASKSFSPSSRPVRSSKKTGCSNPKFNLYMGRSSLGTSSAACSGLACASRC